MGEIQYEGVEESVGHLPTWVRFEGVEYLPCVQRMSCGDGRLTGRFTSRVFLHLYQQQGRSVISGISRASVHFSIEEALETVCDGIQSTSHFERFVTFIEESVSTPDHAHQVFTRIAPLRETLEVGRAVDAYQVLLMKLGAMLTPVPGPALVVAEAIAARLGACGALTPGTAWADSSGRMRSVIQRECL